MAKKMRRGGSARGGNRPFQKGYKPSNAQKQRYYKLIEKGAQNTMRALAKHNPTAAERIARSII